MTITKKIKQLTESQCLHIASLILPKTKWKYIKSENKWDGHDLIDYNVSEQDKKNGLQKVFQISYVKDIWFKDRFLYYCDGYMYSLSEDQLIKIKDYLDSLD